MMSKIRTHYDNLKITRNAPDAVIRAAYRALMQQYHPDKVEVAKQPEALRITHIIRGAYDVLSDPVQRAEYDRKISEEENSSKSSHKNQKERENRGRQTHEANAREEHTARQERENQTRTRADDDLVNEYVDATKPIKRKWVAVFLALFLGFIGAHRFYLGYYKIGIAQIAATALTQGYGVLWGFIEAIFLLFGWINKDAKNRKLK